MYEYFTSAPSLGTVPAEEEAASAGMEMVANDNLNGRSLL